MAAANPIDGSIRDTVSTDAQMDFSGTILSRFDLIFLIRDVRDLDRDRTLANHVIGIHQGMSQNEDSAPIKIGGLKKYIQYCRQRCAPRLSADAEATLKNHYIEIRSRMRNEKEAGGGSTIPITVRQYAHCKSLLKEFDFRSKLFFLTLINVSNLQNVKQVRSHHAN